jgi:hypothetical protein
MIKKALITNLVEAERLWRQLSPKEIIYDLWDFRYPFYKVYSYPLYFHAIYEDDEPVALLPLQLNKDWNGLEFIAEELAYDNKPFIKKGYEYLIPELFNNLGGRVKIFDIAEIDDFTKKLPLEENSVYFYNIDKFTCFDDFLLSAFPGGRKRYNFKRLFINLERNHDVKVLHDNYSDLELLMDFNVKYFGEESYLRSSEERLPYFDLIKQPFNWNMITIEIDGKKVAVSLSLIYKETYYYLIVGSDISEFPDAFKYLTKVNLELAIKNKTKIFNCALGRGGWKEYWHLKKYPQHEFIQEV